MENKYDLRMLSERTLIIIRQSESSKIYELRVLIRSIVTKRECTTMFSMISIGKMQCTNLNPTDRC